MSRKPARPDGRGRSDEYDDYDGYADDGYQSEENWSPGEYFSPEGIKGKWAGENPDGRSGGRGRRDGDRGEAGYDTYGNDFNGAEYGGSAGYGSDEFATAMYDLPEGADEDRSDRSRRRRSRDREDRGERTGILRLRRDRGEDIWPDDGISDEDYWASVAADRPLNGADSPPENVPGASGAGSRPGPDARPGQDSRFGGEQRGGERGVTGRLGPPPGLASDYKPGAAPAGAGSPGSASPVSGTGGMSRPGQAGGSGRAASGPMPARPGTGPRPARPGTGPTPTVGVTASRPPAGPSAMRPGPAQPGPGSSFPQPAAPRPSFQPTSRQSGALPSGAPAGGRQQDRGSDWGDRTERIERVNAAGYPEPRSGGRSQSPSSPGSPRASGPLGLGTSATPGLPGAHGTHGTSGASGRGRADNAAWRAPDRQAGERREPDRREPSREGGREASGPWPAPVPTRGGSTARSGADDDPLTSKAYSRSAMSETDGRSYRVAARRSQAQVKLTEQAETFMSAQYQQSAQQQGRTGEYWQYRDDAQAPAQQAPAGRYPAPGSQGPGGQGGHPAQPGRGQAAPGQAPGHGGQPGQPGRGSGRPGLPGAGAGLPGGPYDAQVQQPRPSQQQRQQPQQRQPQLPATGAPTAGSPSVSDPGTVRPTGSAGLNPYDAGATGSYPYPNQSYPARPAAAGPVPDGTDGRYYRPSPPDGSGAGGTGQGRGDQGRGGNGYPASGDRRH
ncbi:MAG TPA: hypothetical protein VGG25_17505 [Streptosporangiaceae bacterium]